MFDLVSGADIPGIDRTGDCRIVCALYYRPRVPKNRNFLTVNIEAHQIFIVFHGHVCRKSFSKLFQIEFRWPRRRDLYRVSAAEDRREFFCFSVKKFVFMNAQHTQSAFGDVSLIRCQSFDQTSICISERCREVVSPTSSFIASVTCIAEILAMIGMMTPAVSQVGELPASGMSSNMHRRHGVRPGITVIVVP